MAFFKAITLNVICVLMTCPNISNYLLKNGNHSSSTSHSSFLVLTISSKTSNLPSCPDELSWWLRWYRIQLQCGRPGFDPWVGKIPWRRAWQPTPVFLPGESHDRQAWRATVHGVTKSRTQLSN